jgi:hypothetical protein
MLSFIFTVGSIIIFIIHGKKKDGNFGEPTTTFPKGPAIEPPGFCGPWPEIYALSPLMCIHVRGVLTLDDICSCFGRDKPRDFDVVIDIQYCGICHSNIHQVNNEWKGTNAFFPMLPGHKNTGII